MNEARIDFYVTMQHIAYRLFFYHLGYLYHKYIEKYDKLKERKNARTKQAKEKSLDTK